MGTIMNLLIGILIFFVINIGFTIAFRFWDFHWYIDDLTESIKDWWNK